MKKVFFLLAALLFTVNMSFAKDKKPPQSAKDSTKTTLVAPSQMQKAMSEAPQKSETDTTKPKTVTIELPLSIDASTPTTLFVSIGAILMVFFQIITGYFTKANEWLKGIVPITTWRVSIIPLIAAFAALIFFKFSQPAITLFIAQLFGILTGQNVYDKFLASKK